MSNLPVASPYRSTPDRPVDETERARITEQLNQAYADGTVEVADYQDLLDRVYSARTLGELVPVVEMLPVPPTYQVPDTVLNQGRGPGELESRQQALNLSRYVVLGSVGLLVVVVLMLGLLL